MWIVLTVPFMILGVAVAVVPVAVGSIHFHRRERAVAVLAAQPASEQVGAELASPAKRVACPLCTTMLHAVGDTELVDMVRRHAWREHGIPSDSHILESALVA